MQYEYIANREQLVEFCAAVGSADTLAFDTEFVSEDRFHPELCLVQVAAANALAVIDPLAIDDLAPLWELLAAPAHDTVVHAGRYELCFCLRAIGRRPHQLFDTQIAAGLTGMEYPAAFSTLVSRLLGRRVTKGETRTDWRRRPLSQRQIDYALQDAVDLLPLHRRLVEQLDRRGRGAWLESEMEDWQTQVEAAEFGESWRRLSGTGGLSPRGLAIVRELSRWRELEARQQNRPPRRILRDDLIVELARRETADVSQIHVLRGLQWRDKSRYLKSIAECIATALELPEDSCPGAPARQGGKSQFLVLSQFLATALGAICREQHVAPSLVGNLQEIRDFVCYRLSPGEWLEDSPPSLARGWRAEVIGSKLNQILDGSIAVRIGNPRADEPLCFEPIRNP